MALKDFFKLFSGTNEPSSTMVHSKIEREAPTAYNQVVSMSFDGEKNLGEMGPIKSYQADYDSLRLRSWQLYLDSPVCQMVFQRFSTWVIGQGLRLGSDPMHSILNTENIKVPNDFIGNVEDRYKVYCNSRFSSYSENKTLHDLAKEAFINTIVGGDVLAINRYVDGVVKVELIDGCHVSTPYKFRFDEKLENGNRIRHGVEIDKRGKHIAYYVETKYNNWERIPAYTENGLQQAYLIYGLEYRLDDVRGIPLISAVMETAAKLERYQEATLGSAEEAAKIAYSIEHNHTSTGENPITKSLAIASGRGKPGDIPETYDEQKLLNTVAATTNKQAVNMPIGAKLVSHESKKELYFNDFYTINIQLVCSTIGIPPEVALMKYDSNFSASRAALKDWEHTLNVKRGKFSTQFYKPNYEYWITVEILKNKIQAPGYIKALTNNDVMVINAYRFCRFNGANVPHIDPLKEVHAERAKLGELGKNIPLTTAEKATENLNGGDVYANIVDFKSELDEMNSNLSNQEADS